MKGKNAGALKNSQNSFREENFYVELLDNIQEGVLAVNEKGIILFANNTAERIFNKPKQEITSQPLKKYIPEPKQKDAYISVQGSPDKTYRLHHKVVNLGNTSADIYTLQEITEYKKTEELLSKRSSALTERVKELNTLYKTAKLTASKEIDSEKVLQKTAKILTRGWQYPGITQAKICWGDKCFTSKNYHETPWKQTANIIVSGKPVGSVEVGYQKEMPQADEGPFLKEERKLIDNVADKLGKYFEREESRKQNEFHSKLLDSIGEAVISTDTNGIINYWNTAAEKIYGWSSEEVIGKNILEKTPSREMKSAGKNIMNKVRRGDTWTGEFKVRRKGGKEFNIQVTNSPLLNENSEVTGIIGISKDITSRRKAETISKDYAERLQNVGSNLPGAIYQYKIDSRGKASLPFISGNTEEIYGHSPAHLMANPHLTAEMVHPDDKERYHSEITESLQSLKLYNTEYRIIRPDGKIHWIEVKSKPKKLINEDVIWTGVALNVTDIKNTEQLLVKSEQMFQDISENIPGLVYQFKKTSDGKYLLTYISKSAEKLLGRKLEDLKNTELLFQLVHPEELEEVFNSIRQSENNLSPWFHEFRVRLKNNEYIWLQGRSVPREQADKSIVWNGVIIDITQKKRAEIKLRDSEEELREAQIIAQMGNFEVDVFGGEMRWSDEIFRLLKIKNIKPVVGVGEFSDIVFKEDRWKIRHYIKEVRNTGKRASFDLKVHLPDNGYKYLQIIGKPKLDENNKVIGIIGTAMDITERKKFEIELSKAKEKAEESDRLKSVFLQTMSHELRTPLNAIIGFSDLIVKGHAEAEQQNEFIYLINTSGKNLLSIIEDMFEISALETGQSKVQLNEIKLPAFFKGITSTVEDHRKNIDKQHLKLEFKPDLAFDELIIKSDKSKIERVLRNLLFNALKFTKTGKIVYGYEKQGQDLLFFVRDTGIGIPKDKHLLIFEKFRQAEESPTRNFEGVGLGLSICKIIAEMLKADIWVESTEGEGATFFFRLKGAIEKSTANKPEEEANSKPGDFHKGKNVLVVEDEEANMKLIEIILMRDGMHVIKAKNGKEALEIFQSNASIDIVIMDLKMPVMNGFEATRELMKINDKIPVIALTAYALEGDRQKALQAGCVDYISKPLNRKDLIQKIEKHLNN